MTDERSVFVCTDEALANYGFGQGHPFGPDRLDAFLAEFRAQGLDARVHEVGAAVAEATELERFHTHDYVERVRAQSRLGVGYLDYGDTPAFQGVYEAAGTVVGATLDAVARVMRNDCRRAFVPIAGLHHARRDSAAGFCVFNDCGVAIETLRRNHGLERIAYVDIDAHHGDGVFYAFEDDPHVIFADVHEDGHHLYPGTGHAEETGRGEAEGTKLNIPMPPESDDAAFFDAWERVEAFLREARPQFIVMQCGADSIGGDPITHLRYTPAAHAHAATRLCAVAEDHCEGRIVATGGGGYNRDNLARAWSAVVAALIDAPVGAGK